MKIRFLKGLEKFIGKYIIKKTIPCALCSSEFKPENQLIKELLSEFESKDCSVNYRPYKVFKNVNAQEGVTEQSVIKLNEIRELLKNESIDNPKLLSVGCGVKGLEKIYDRIGFDSYGVDIDIKEETDKLKWHNLNENNDLPFEEDYFDVIVCQEVIEHIENPWLLYRKINRVLKTNGYLILTTPNIHSYKGKKIFVKNNEGYMFNFTKETSWQHINPLPYWEVEYVSQYNGFELQDLTGNYEYFLDFKNFLFGKADKKTLTIENNDVLIYIYKKFKNQRELYIPTSTHEYELEVTAN